MEKNSKYYEKEFISIVIGYHPSANIIQRRSEVFNPALGGNR